MQSKEIMDKSKITVKEKYGVDNISQLPEIIKKLKDRWYEIDPITGKTNLEINLSKIKATVKEKYGVDYYYQSIEFKEKMKKHFISKYGVDNIRKSVFYKKLMIEKGIWYTDEENTLKHKYYLEVLKYTKHSYNKNFDLLCATYVRGIHYHLDHIYSILEGYKNNIDPIIIGSIINLQIIPAKLNIKKQATCWITKEELLENYKKIHIE